MNLRQRVDGLERNSGVGGEAPERFTVASGEAFTFRRSEFVQLLRDIDGRSRGLPGMASKTGERA